jgi:hypothetical protein
LSEEDSDDKPGPELEWRDYIALTVAALETIFLPLVVLSIMLIVIFLIIR